MQNIVLERNVEYAVWENLIYALVLLLGTFVGMTFFSKGNIANFLSVLSGTLIFVCIIASTIKKGLVVNKKLYRGYFIFRILLYKKEIEVPISKKFTLLKKNFKQKYIRAHNEPNWEYTVDSFELYFFDEDGAIRDNILKLSNKSNTDRAIEFLEKYCNFEFVTLSKNSQ